MLKEKQRNLKPLNPKKKKSDFVVEVGSLPDSSDNEELPDKTALTDGKKINWVMN